MAPPGAQASPAAPPSSASETGAAETGAAEACIAGCQLLASCHLGSASCETECEKGGTLSSCLRQADRSCNRFAACWFAASCRGARPAGGHSCSAAMDCETSCNGEPGCICGCIAGVSIHHAATLLGYNGCALGCRDAGCIAQRCGSQARACRAE